MRPHLELFHSDYSSRLTKQFTKATKNLSNIDTRIIKTLVQRKFPPALHFMGEAHEVGLPPFERNLTLALDYFTRSGKAGYGESYSNLAFYYSYGIEIEKNELLAAIYRSLAAQENSVRSILSLGISHTFGVNHPYSLRSAIDLFIPVAGATVLLLDENSISKHIPQRISNTYTIQPHTKTTDDSTLKMIEYQAEHGDPAAEINLGIIRYQGQFGSHINYTEARELFEKHPEDHRSNTFLGRMYHFGQGVKQDTELAREYYFKCPDDADALASLGLLEMSEGNSEEAEDYFAKAALLGHDGASFNLAMLRMQSDEQIAYRSIKKLQKKGVPMATYYVATKLASGQPKFNEKKSVVYLTDIFRKGPWVRVAEEAEKAFLAKHYEEALLLWMELGDMGIEVAAYNAGCMLVEWRRFFQNPPFHASANETLENGIRMLEMSYNLGYRKSAAIIGQALFSIGNKTEGTQWLLKGGKSASSAYSVAVLALEGKVIERNYMAFAGNLTKAFNLQKSTILPVMFLFTKSTVLLAVDFICGKHNDDMNDFLFFILNNIKYWIVMATMMTALHFAIKIRVYSLIKK